MQPNPAMSKTRNPVILSALQSPAVASPVAPAVASPVAPMSSTAASITTTTSTTTTPSPSLAFDTCHVGVVLRTVLLVEGAVAVVLLFTAQGFAAWVTSVALVTVGALSGTLAWLVAVCAVKRELGRVAQARQLAASGLLGAGAGLYGCAMQQLADATPVAPWLASALSGLLLALLITSALLLRASARAPAALSARVEELQARIRPHFLFNTLNSAIALVREDPTRAETLLEDLSELFRQALADTRDWVTLADEIGLAERYLAIEKVRFGERLQVRWSLDRHGRPRPHPDRVPTQNSHLRNTAN